MKRVFMFFVSLSSICSFSLASAQTGAPEKPRIHASDLIQQGRLDVAVAVLEPEADSPNLDPLLRGRACALLGYAYKEQGKFALAQNSFDRAFRLLDAAGDRSSDYAATLDFYAGLLMSMGNLESAGKALHEAADLDGRLSNHAGLAKIYTHTAELDIERKKYKRAKEALTTARAEAVLAEKSGAAMLPDIDGTLGWLAVSTGKPHQGVVAYAAALEECRGQFGDKHLLTGWSYLLLGKAQELDGDLTGAVRSMDQGLGILKQTVGTNNIRYLAGQLAYSELLNHAGSHTEAARINTAANQSLQRLGIQQCAGCTISVWSLRHEGQ
jgi:tetratricopeptide (TPR) repeat protein